MAYQATPLACGYSPAELLIGRALRTTVPMSQELFKPTVPDLAILRRHEQNANEQQKANFDHRHKACTLIPLNQGDRVCMAT